MKNLYFHTVVLLFFRRFKSSAANKTSKEALKRLNYENKYLFGNLLESNKKRLDRLSKVQPEDKDDPNQGAFELDGINNDNLLNNELETKSIVNQDLEYENAAELTTKNDILKLDQSKDRKIERFYDHNKTKTRLGVEENGETVQQIDQKQVPATSHVIEKLKNTNFSDNLTTVGGILARDIDLNFPLYNPLKVELNPDIIAGIYPSITAFEADNYPAVTRILNASMSDHNRLILNRWKAKMIAEMGKEEFEKYNEAQMKEGTLLHDLINKYLTGTPIEELNIVQELEGCWKSLEVVFPLLSGVKMAESNVVHQTLKYKGIIDCIAQYRGKPVLIDWKKSKKQKFKIAMTYDAPVQIAAYIGALNYDDNYPFKVEEGLLVIAYMDGSRADIFHLSKTDCAKYWKLWLQRLRKYFEVQVGVPSEEDY